ncbi:MAG: redoxin domain-containing protein [Candidatus Heimdallarchaeota archaeon]|nr:redoxin domain-containing protein [Candidatus Heimdallarchaeota archaeon]
MVSIGEQAPTPSMRLTDHETVNQEFDLKEAYSKGTVVLYFFPAAWTGVCTESSCQIRDEIEEFKDLKVQMFGASNNMPFSHRRFIQDHNLNFPLLSDWNKEAITAFDIVDDDFANGLKGVSKRSLFVIKNGVLSYKWIAEHPGTYPPLAELKAHLSK